MILEDDADIEIPIMKKKTPKISPVSYVLSKPTEEISKENLMKRKAEKGEDKLKKITGILGVNNNHIPISILASGQLASRMFENEMQMICLHHSIIKN